MVDVVTPDLPYPGAALPPGSRRPQRHGQLADPAVSKAKFEWEVTHFRESEAAHRGRGIILIRTEFPEVLLAFAATHIHPAPVVFGAMVDYTDYDHSPPSLRLVDPFTERSYRAEEMPPPLLRRTVTLGRPSGSDARFEVRRLVQSPDGSLPSVCVPGTRDYYGQPGVGRDAWSLDRHNDVGSLASLVEHLYAYAVAASDPYPERVLVQADGLASAADDPLLGEISRPDPGPSPP